jgi:hypothetical protein
MSYPSCPRCGFNKKAGFFTGSHFYVYRCSECDTLYCYECRGSNGGRKCPECASERRQTAGTVYLK